MLTRIFTLLLFIISFTTSVVAQNQDVIFKVRKPKEQTITISENKSKYSIKAKTKEVFVVVEENATFQGGDLQSFKTWIEDNIKYPENAAKKRIEGTLKYNEKANNTIWMVTYNNKIGVFTARDFRNLPKSSQRCTLSMRQIKTPIHNSEEFIRLYKAGFEEATN